jgi:hypothetical protein
MTRKTIVQYPCSGVKDTRGCGQVAAGEAPKEVEHHKREQHGFQAARSTSTADQCMVHDCPDMKNQGKEVGLVLFDLSSAFNLLDASILVKKLKIYGVGESACKWVLSYMSGRRQLVQIGQSQSSLHPISYGVPQGGTLSPLLFVVFTADMTEAPKGIALVLYASDTAGMVWADTREEVYQKIESREGETLNYMRCNKLAPNAGKTQFMVLGKGELKQIIVGGAPVQESSQVTFLGFNWSEHVGKVEKEMATRTGILYRLRNFLPRKAIVQVIPGFVCIPATYMLHVVSDVTGQERSSESSLHKLQMRYKDSIRTALNIKREDHVGTLELLRQSCLPSMNDLSVRANCVMAWRVLSEFGDTQEIATDRLNPHKFARDTRAAAAGKMCSYNRFSSFVSKSTLLFNLKSDTINIKKLKSKEAAKMTIKKNCDKIWSRLPKRQ